MNKLNYNYSIIGTSKTAELYNLNVLKEHIEDDKDNNRRFIVIGDGITKSTGNDKTSIVMFLDDDEFLWYDMNLPLDAALMKQFKMLDL